MIDLDKHVERLEQGAKCPVDLGGGNTFTLLVRKAGIGDSRFYKILEFVEGLSDTDQASVDKIKANGEDLTGEELEEFVGGMKSAILAEGFADGLKELCDYVVNDLACGWEGISKGDTEEPREFDRDLLGKALHHNPLVPIGIFAFAMASENFGDEPEEAAKN